MEIGATQESFGSSGYDDLVAAPQSGLSNAVAQNSASPLSPITELPNSAPVEELESVVEQQVTTVTEVTTVVESAVTAEAEVQAPTVDEKGPDQSNGPIEETPGAESVDEASVEDTVAASGGMQSAQTNVDDLFGEDEEYVEPSHRMEDDEFDDDDAQIETHLQPKQRLETVREDIEEVVDYEPLAEDYEDDGRVITWSIERPPTSPGMSEKITLLGLPLTVEIDNEIFDPVGYAELEKKIVKERQRENYKSLRLALAPGKIRVEEVGDKLQSNTRFVEFSDGSCALFIGKNAYEADRPADESASSSWLMETTLEPIYFVHGKIDQRVLFRPPATVFDSVSAADGPGRTRLTTVSKGAESEMKLKRQREHELQQHAAKKKRATPSLDASFIERD